MSQPDDEKPELTPEELAYTHLPDQTMYKVRIDDAGGEDSDDARLHPLAVRTNEFRALYFEIDPPGKIDWHTHAPGFDEVNLCLEGRAKYTLEREDGGHQVIEVDPMEFVYLPGGARHKIEAVGNHRHTSLSIARFDTIARLEALEDFEGEAMPGSDEDEWQPALWVDRKRDEVVAKDETLVSE